MPGIWRPLSERKRLASVFTHLRSTVVLRTLTMSPVLVTARPGFGGVLPTTTQTRLVILDCYHAYEHLGTVAKAWYGEGTDPSKCWLEARKLDLLSDCIETVIRSIRSWHPADDEAKEIRRRELAYFEKNKDRMMYATLTAITSEVDWSKAPARQS